MRFFVLIVSFLIYISCKSQDLKIIPQNGHNSSIESMEISYSGKFIASQGKDRKLVIHNLESEKIIFQKILHNFKLWGITKDERFVLVDENNYRYLLSPFQSDLILDSTIQVLGGPINLNDLGNPTGVFMNGEQLSTPYGNYMTRFTDKYFTCYDNIDSLVVAADSEGRVLVVSSTKKDFLWAHTAKVNVVSISMDKKFFVSAGDDRAIIVWDAKSLRIKTIIENKSIPLTSITVEKNKILAGDNYGNIYLLKNLFTIPTFNSIKISETKINDIAFLTNGRIVAGAQENYIFKLDSNLFHVVKYKLNKSKRGYRLKYAINDKLNFAQPPSTEVYGLYKVKDELYIWYNHKNNYTKSFADIGNGKNINGNLNATHFIYDKYNNNQLVDLATQKDSLVLNFYTGKEIRKMKYFIPYSLFYTEGTSQKNALTKKVWIDSQYVFAAIKESFFVYDKFSGKLKTKIDSIHEADISAIQELNNRYLTTSSLDGTLNIIDKENLEKKLSLILFQEGFLITNKDGYYYSNIRNIDDYVSFIYKGKEMTSDQLEMNFNRPEIILNDISEAKEMLKLFKAVRENKLLKNKMVDQEDYLTKAPVCKFENQDSIFFGYKENEFTISFYVEDPLKSKLTFYLYNNDVSIKINSADISTLPDNNYLVTKSIKLMNGSNEIRFSAQNEKGVISNTLHRTVMYSESEKKGDLYIIGIGVSEYKSSKYNLEYASKDVNDFSKMMKSKSGNFNKVRIFLFTNEMVNEKMMDSLNAVFTKINYSDGLIIHYAGHGVIGNDLQFYLAMHNTDFDHPENTSLSLGEVSELLKNANCYRKTLILDACHSGEIDEDAIVSNQVSVSEKVKFRSSNNSVKANFNLGEKAYRHYIKELLQINVSSSGANILSGSTGYELSMESDQWMNGLFTFSLLDALKNKQESDLNNNGNLNIEEIQKYAALKVSELSNGKQNPEARELNKKVEFKIK